MESTRFLVPFTRGMHAYALEQAMLLAKDRHATLISAGLICVAKDQHQKGPRLEFVEQSNDFLEAVRCKAARYQVPVEQVEVVTSDVALCIDTLAKKMECAGILLFVQKQTGLLLGSEEVRRVMERCAGRLYIFHLDTKDSVRLQIV